MDGERESKVRGRVRERTTLKGGGRKVEDIERKGCKGNMGWRMR